MIELISETMIAYPPIGRDALMEEDGWVVMDVLEIRLEIME